MQESSNKVDQVNLVVEKVRDHTEEGIIGGYFSHVAMKTHNSYLMATDDKGLVLVKNGAQMFSGKLQKGDSSLYDVIFLPSQNSYLLISGTKIYHKIADGKPPSLYMSIKCGGRMGACLRYSTIQQRLIINQGGKNMWMINEKTKKVEVKWNHRKDDQIMDFKIFGEEEKKVVSVTYKGCVRLYCLDNSLKNGFSQHQIKFENENRESALSLAVCPMNTYIFVETIENLISSRTIILKLTGNSFVQVAILDKLSEWVGSLWTLESFKYVGKHVLFIGLPFKKNESAQLFEFNTETNECKELKEKRVIHQEYRPSKLHRLGNKFYYTGFGGKLMRLSLIM